VDVPAVRAAEVPRAAETRGTHLVTRGRQRAALDVNADCHRDRDARRFAILATVASAAAAATRVAAHGYSTSLRRALRCGMGEIDEQISEAVDKARESRLNAAVAAFVALSATFMALNNVKDGNIVQAMQQAQANGVDAWAYYQAKGTKANLAISAREQIELMRDTSPNATPEVRAVFDKRIAEYTALEHKYEAEKEDIKRQAEGFQKQYDALNVHDDQFDMAEALLSVAIALFGVTALTRKRWLLGVAIVFAGFGTILGLAGFLGWDLHPDWLARLLG